MYAIVIHGGAGTISRASLSQQQEGAYRAVLERIVRQAHDILAQGGTSLDAVTAAVVELENHHLFNAGYGAVFNASGQHELDAAVMDGATLEAGCVAGLKRAKNPVLVARTVMEKTRHIMLAGEGADTFAESQGLEMVSPDYFHTENRQRAFERVQQQLRANQPKAAISDEDKHGTVGAVALDAAGNLAAATSTGGHTHKMVGRIGDSPIIGAGTYADNETCAVSCTGDGEYFIRIAAAHDVASRMRYLSESIHDAALHVVTKTLPDLGGTGGLIAIDRRGNIAMPFNTSGMYRAAIDVTGDLSIGIYRS
ncbi:MAG: isoaspartyl peptidase/L-asparaginase [Pseudomonadota bacterium]